jgi:radical SAM enzyme (rSAM/lipoprotein system)
MNNNLKREHPLRQLFWESTLRCNMHCRHCGSDCKAVTTKPDMPREDFFRVLDGIAAKMDPHQVFVIVSGGEPLMREDLELCGKGIYERGFPWGMVTNGLYLTPQRFHNLRAAGLCSVAVSFDGLEDSHNWLRRNPQSFEMADQALDLLVADGRIKFDAVTCVNQMNYDQLPAIRDHLIKKGVKAWRLFPIFPMGRAATDPMLQVSNEQFRQLLNFIRETRREGKIHANYSCEGFIGDYEGDVRDWMFRCAAGVTVGSVLIDGSISACTSIRSNYIQGNIYKDDFLDVWENRYQPYRDRSWMKKDECKDCRYWRYCEGNGMHLRTDDGRLLVCHIKRIEET